MELVYVQHVTRQNLEDQVKSWHATLLEASELAPSLHCKQDTTKIDEHLRLQCCELDRHLESGSLQKLCPRHEQDIL